MVTMITAVGLTDSTWPIKDNKQPTIITSRDDIIGRNDPVKEERPGEAPTAMYRSLVAPMPVLSMAACVKAYCTTVLTEATISMSV